jgi:hypothetical protein
MVRTVVLISLLAAASPAHAQLKARVVSRIDATQGIPSRIRMSHNGVETTVGQTFADGGGTLSVVNCEPSMRFRPLPVQSWAWTPNQTKDWKGCSGDRVDLELSPSDGFASFMGAFQNSSATFAGAAAPQLSTWQEALQKAGDEGDAASVGVIANEMAYTLYTTGDPALGARYRSLAVAAGTASLESLGIETPDQVLVYDPDKKAFVASTGTINALIVFKTQQELGGQKDIWDGATFRRIEILVAARSGSF